MDEVRKRTSLLDVLSNSVILRQLGPYLSAASALALSAVSHSYRVVLQVSSPGDLFRHLDLSRVKSVLAYAPIDTGGINWRSQRMDENLTEEEFYSGPLRGIFSSLTRIHALEFVQTLILDGLPVTSDLVHEILTEDRFSIRILSIRECPQINARKLMQVLQYAVRPSRPKGTPRLQGLYLFGPKDSNCSTNGTFKPSENDGFVVDGTEGGIMSAEGAQIGSQWNQRSQEVLSSSVRGGENRWYRSSGRMFKQPLLSAWADTLKTCEGIIAFDAVLCRGPRHDINNIKYIKERGGTPYQTWIQSPAIATIALGSGCVKCSSCVEKPAQFGKSPSHHLPLLAPPPLHSSTVRAAQRPWMATVSDCPSLFVRCEDCLRGRWCERCMKWWDEECYSPPADGKRMPEVSDSTDVKTTSPNENPIKIYMGLCAENCLVGEMMSGAGSFGMWG